MPRLSPTNRRALHATTEAEVTNATTQLVSAYGLTNKQAYEILLYAKDTFNLRMALEKKIRASFFGSHHQTITNTVDRHLRTLLDPAYSPPPAGGKRAGAGRKRKENTEEQESGSAPLGNCKACGEQAILCQLSEAAFFVRVIRRVKCREYRKKTHRGGKTLKKSCQTATMPTEADAISAWNNDFAVQEEQE